MLLIDAGNSRIKSALKQDAELQELGAIDTASREPPPDWAAVDSPECVLVSSVAGDTVEQKIEQWVTARFSLRPQFARVRAEAAGMTTHYDNPAQLGVDRWLAALAGYHLAEGAACVVDAGTALTIDVVDGSGNHLGGSISPGLSLMIKSLNANTARLQLDNFEPPDAIATNTAAAISLGCIDAVIGGIERMQRRLRGLMPATAWYATGGEAGILTQASDIEFVHVPNLVLQGLALAIGDGR